MNLWETLGLREGASDEAIKEAYLSIRARASEEEAKAARYAWKALTDPYFKATYKHYPSIPNLVAAGFFDDNVEPEEIISLEETLDLLTTPVHKAYERLVVGGDTKPPVVLLTTGGFSPIHRGHIQMMERARRALEKQGRTVIGGYFSPSHDAYVSLKYDGTAALSAPHRLRLCEVAVEPLPWLMVDPFEARYVGTELNFTQITYRLQAYLRRHLHPDVEVFYVFGSDNAAFMRAFVESGGGVCIVREGHDHWKEIEIDPLIASHPDRFVFAPNDNEVAVASSSAVRGGNMDILPNRVVKTCESWGLRWDEVGEPHEKSLSPTSHWYAIRDDLDWAIEPFAARVNPSSLSSASATFKEGVVSLVKESFLSVSWPDKPREMDVVLLDRSEQNKYVESLLHEKKLINLDVSTPGTIKLEFSRLFGVSDGQVKAHELVGRPGHPSLPDQALAVPAGIYSLVDDDIATGYTLDTVSRMLSEDVEVEERISLLAHTTFLLGRDEEAYDVIDMRDLLLGGRESGLVVEMPNGVPVRAPYMLPYVAPSSRAKIPPSSEYSFSLALWKLNREFFAALDYKMQLKDMDSLTQTFFSLLGFSLEAQVVEICDWHIEKLEDLPFLTFEEKILSPSTLVAKELLAQKS
jgi:nicotinic acid mononucleotide adenylyltransferase